MILVLGALVTWRLSHMIVKESGPFNVFARFRAWAARNQKNPGGLFDGITCVACTSIYIGAVTALWPAGDVLSWLLYTFAFSAVAVLLEAIHARIKS